MARVFLIGCLVFALALSAMAKKQFRKPPAGTKQLSDDVINSLPGFKRSPRHRAVGIMPDSFDSRTKWPNCVSIKTIRNQGQCGTCWAVSSASVLSDRLCIASGQTLNVFVSAAQACSCSQPNESPNANCNDGGDAQQVYQFATTNGLVTGGEYNTNVGCVPYPVAPSAKPPISCSTSCTNSNYNTAYTKDFRFVEGYWAKYKKSTDVMDAATIADRVKTIQEDVLVNGPVTIAITAWTDFGDWEPPMEPYCKPGPGAKNEGGHAMRLIGWGKSPKGTKYWLIANSWGNEVGDKGTFQIEMGKNCIGIEESISAPIVSIPNTCVSSTIQEQAFDSAILAEPSNPNSAVYIFQGNCTLKVNVGSDGKLKAAGPAVPIGKQFLGLPDAPITSAMYQGGDVWIVNNKGEAGASCAATGTTGKVACSGRGSVSGGSSNSYVYINIPSSSGVSKYTIDNNQLSWVFNSAGRGINVGTTLSGSLSKVTSAVAVPGGSKAVIFGQDKSGKPVSGVLNLTGTPSWAQQPGPQKSSFS